MTNSADSALLNLLTEATQLASDLILKLKENAEILTVEEATPPADLVETQNKFLTRLNQILEQTSKDVSLLGKAEVSLAFNTLNALIADIRIAPWDSLIESHPEVIDFYYKRAGVLFSVGRDEEASNDYQAVLNREPTNFGALNDLGILQIEAGDHQAARHSFGLAVEYHPTLPIGHVNYADFLLLQCEYEAAKKHYLIALELDPTLQKALQGLSHVYTGLGDEAKAAEFREQGFREQAVIAWPYRGTGKALPVLILGSAFGGNVPINHILDKHTFQSTVILTEYFDPATPLPPHKLIINFIGDADLSRKGLDAAEALLARCSSPIINHPALVRPTGRQINARRLGVLPGVKTPRTVLLSRQDLMARTTENLFLEHGIGFPILLRSPGFHTGQYFVRVDEPELLRPTVANLPGEDLLVMQYLDSRNPQGDSHKFRVMFVDGKLYPMHLAISKNWKVHYFSADMEIESEYRTLEARFLEDMTSLLGEKTIAALENIRMVLGLDYGGMDFAIGQDGNILLFEANATMLVRLPENNEKWEYRRAATSRILDAVKTMILNRANA
jgi:tetratricopeptide (TPR) repeat protein